MPTIAQDLLLLLLDDESGKQITDSTKLPRALAGAVVLELALAEAVRVSEKNEETKAGRLVTVRGADLLTDPLITAAYETIRRSKPMKPQRVIEKLQRGLREKVLAQLEKQGSIRQQRTKVLGLFPTTKWPARDTRRKQAVRLELERALIHNATPSPHNAALISLLSAIDGVHKVFPDADRKAIKKRATEIAEGEWAGTAVRKAVEAVNTTVLAAVLVSVTAGATASG
ncbi:GPP34 family phosphoprotein [Antrihabitans sp. YC2-6]|uniref:GOLPH3/VPS74 family protein n=1 Tax=Antrihabitans sp. YC2-6 TaxID=2799498 RepID=UPI0018F4C39F|nr:GPP34 family phosphoprotein [Antrihabitans sp. YC2-6]MBJ8344185.1 GPP34 family phosphoprotein [Antrihabitans sp. YC2-6]